MEKKKNPEQSISILRVWKGTDTKAVKKVALKKAINELEKIRVSWDLKRKVPAAWRGEPEELDELRSPPWPRDAKRKSRFLRFHDRRKIGWR